MPVYIAAVNSISDGTGSVEFGPVYGIPGPLDYDFNVSAAAGTDVTLTVSGGVNRTILTLTNINTDGTYYPQQNVNNQSGTQQTSNFMPNMFFGEKVVATVAGAGGALTPAVTLYFRTME